MEEIYFAGGCLWGVQEYMRHLPGVVQTEAGRANGTSLVTRGNYDGYAECVKVRFDAGKVSVLRLMEYFFEIIDPYSLNQQGPDVGRKYRTGVYSLDSAHLQQASTYIANRTDSERVVVEVQPLSNYVKSHETHQDRLTRNPDEPCHIPRTLLHKYRQRDI